MIKAAPVAAFIVIECGLILHLLVIAVDAPAHLQQLHQKLQAGLPANAREPVLRRRSVCRHTLLLTTAAIENPVQPDHCARGRGETSLGLKTASAILM
jgi:hypothetical protein